MPLPMPLPRLSRLPLLGLPLLLALELPAAAVEPAVVEPAFQALAAGRSAEAERALVRAIAGASAADQADLRCVLGRVQRVTGQPRAAALTLAAVPLEAPCGRRAAFERADALAELGDTAGAAQIYAAAGRPVMGEDRDHAVVDYAIKLADRIVADPDMDDGTAAALLGLGLDARLSTAHEVSLHRRLADLLLRELDADRPVNETLRGQSSEALRGLVLAGALPDEPALRRQLARLAQTPADAVALLAPLAADAETLAVRARILTPHGVDRARPDWERLLGMDAAASLAARRALGLTLSAEGSRDAFALLDGIDDEHRGSEEEADLVSLAVATGDLADVVRRAERWLQRFPSGEQRPEVERWRRDAMLGLARQALHDRQPAVALAADEAFLAAFPNDEEVSRVAFEAGLAARAAGDLPGARRRWEEVLARWPGGYDAQQSVAAIAKLIAFDQGKPEEALSWLRAQQADGDRAGAAAAVRAELEEADVSIASLRRQDPRSTPTVRLAARNLETLNLRLHPIDPVAFLRAGHGPASLPDLDVAVIAPEREWAVAVPGYVPARQLRFDAPLPKVGAGLYAVTAAAPTREARSLVMVSDLDLIARVNGPDLAVAVLRHGQRVRGARVLVWADGLILDGKTDGDGLFTTETSARRLIVLGLDGGSPALVELSRPSAGAAVEPTVEAQAELDRPAYRPGDRVGLRIVARKGEAPVVGAWSVWLSVGGVDLDPIRLEADRRGLLHGALPLPKRHTGLRAAKGVLRGRAPGSSQVVDLARFTVVDEAEGQRHLRGEWVEAGEGAAGRVRFRLQEADGRPVVGARLHWTLNPGTKEGSGTTDPRGELWLDAPPEGLGWTVTADLPGSTLRETAGPPYDPAAALFVEADQDVLRPGEPLKLQLRGGQGEARLRLLALDGVSEPAPVPEADPWSERLAHALEGPKSWQGAAPPEEAGGLVRSVWTGSQRLPAADGAAPVELRVPTTGLAPGRYRLVTVDEAGMIVHLELRIATEGLRLVGLPSRIPVGRPLEVGVEGAPALLTVEGGRQPVERLLQPGERLTLTPGEGWGDTSQHIKVCATAVDGTTHCRDVSLERDLRVTTKVEERDGQWVIDLSVTDAAGAPTRAELALSALDDRFVSGAGLPSRIWASRFRGLHTAATPAGGVASAFQHGRESEAVSAALLAESAREEEQRRARDAASGKLSSSRAFIVMDESILITSEGLGSIGARGMGGGASGYGSGGGSLGGVGRGGVAGGGLTRLPGHREAAVWLVKDTDEQGHLRVVVDRPPVIADWTLRVTAATATALGHDEQALPAARVPHLELPSPGPGRPGDRLDPLLTLVGEGTAPFRGSLRVGRDTTPVTVQPGEALRLPLGALLPGEERAVVLLDEGGRVIEEATLRFPLFTGPLDPGGDVVSVSIGAGGGLPFVPLALADDPGAAFDPVRAARQGLAALAALPAAEGAEREALLAAVRATRGALLEAGLPVGLPEVALFHVEAAGLVGLSRAQLGALSEGGEGPVEERLLLLIARAKAGQPVEEGTVARLLREGPRLSEVGAARLGRLLVALGRPEEAKAALRGAGPEAALLRRQLGLPVDREALLAAGPPLVGEAGRAEWIGALVAPRGQATGLATVSVEGQPPLHLDRGAGGELRFVLPPGATVRVDGPALLTRHGPPAGARAAASAKLPLLRLPAELDGLPAPLDPDADSLRCGAEGPCRLAVGDALRLPGSLTPPGWAAPAGLQVETGTDGRLVLRAVVPGRFTLAGLSVLGAEGVVSPMRPIPVEVGPIDPAAEGGLLDQRIALRVAQGRFAQGGDGAALLDRWASLEDWPEGDRGDVAGLRFQQALRDRRPEAELVARFEDLRDADPGHAIAFDEVVAVADAYGRVGRPDRALDVWRAGLGAAFLAEAAPARQLEDITGRFTSLQAMRELIDRYPVLPVVEEAAFHLPDLAGAMADEPLPPELVNAGVTATDLRLLAAAWGRELVTLHPRAPQVPEAGFALVEGLLRLRAWGPAADWSARLAAAWPESPLQDSFVYLEGVSRSELGQDRRSIDLFERLSTGSFPQEGGALGAARTREDARYALARLHEARGRLTEAKALYAEAAPHRPEARRSEEALSRVELEAQGLVLLKASDSADLPLRLANVDRVHIRAYRLDLRTIFLRDGGLERAREVEIAGISPVWSGEAPGNAAPFPREVELGLPLRGAGAWLIQLDGGGRTATSLVVRSDLEMDSLLEGGLQRVTLHHGSGAPAAGIEVRAVAGGEVKASRTDLRGVTTLPAASLVLAWDGDDLAFTAPQGAHDGWGAPPASPAPPRGMPMESEDDLLDGLRNDLQEQRARNAAGYEQRYQKQAAEAIDANML